MTTPVNDAEPTKEGLAEDAVDRIRSNYVSLLGLVPPSIETRIRVAGFTNRHQAVEAIEHLRNELILNNSLGRSTGQLVHFGQLVVLGREGPARLHARAARNAGATFEELVGVAELALITAGMPAYSLGIEIISELIDEQVPAGHHNSI